MNKKRKREKRRRLAEAIKPRLKLEAKLAKSKPAKASSCLHHIDEYYKEHPDIQAIL